MMALADLWNLCYVANTEDEAFAQAHRQIEPFIGKVLTISGAMGFGDALTEPEVDFLEPVAFRVTSLGDEGEWTGEELIPEWNVAPVDPNQVVTVRGRPLRLGDVCEWLYFAPGIGTRDGFTPRDGRVFIEPEVAASNRLRADELKIAGRRHRRTTSEYPTRKRAIMKVTITTRCRALVTQEWDVELPDDFPIHDERDDRDWIDIIGEHPVTDCRTAVDHEEGWTFESWGRVTDEETTVEWTPAGVDYCIAHHGIREADQPDCDFIGDDRKPCDLRPLFYETQLVQVPVTT